MAFGQRLSLRCTTAEACLSCPIPASFTYGDNTQSLLARTEDNTFSTMTTTSLAVTTAYLHHDHLGSVIFISGEDGAVVAGSWTHTLPFGGYDNGPPTAEITDLGYTTSDGTSPITMTWG